MKKLLNKNQKGSVVVVIIVVVFVFLLLTSVGVYLLYKNVLMPMMEESSKSGDKSTQVYKTIMRGEIPSSCGYTLDWPTTFVEKPAYKEWIYEEVTAAGENFRGIVPEDQTKNGVLLSTMLFKTQKEKFGDEKTYQFGQPGYISYCTNNVKNWSLNDFVSYVKEKKTDKFEYEVTEEPSNFGEIKVQKITVKGIFNGSYVNEYMYLAVIPEGSTNSRLVLFQLWGNNDNGKLATDLTAITGSFKKREMKDKLVITGAKVINNTNNTTTQVAPPSTPTCTQYTIREGQFKSDKCYGAKDLQDLKYYISQYNNAVFDQNAAANKANTTCNGSSSMFKQLCEEAKDDYDDAKDDVEEYAAKIRSIIAKGK